MKLRALLAIGLMGCTPMPANPVPGFDVRIADIHFGGEIPGGGVFTGVIDTIRVARRVGGPLRENDKGLALKAVRAFCAAQSGLFEGDGSSSNPNLPSFFEGTWEFAGRCDVDESTL